jgi:hypothetical protein
MMVQTVSVDAVKRKLKFDYLKAKNDVESRNLDVFSHLLDHFLRPQLSISELMHDTATTIQKQFRLRWVMIGLKDRTDGKYRYMFMSGMRDEAWARQKTKSYKLEDFAPNSNGYKAGEISGLSRAYLEEENPLFDEDITVVNRPALLRSRRKSDDETLEADFIDTLIVGPGNELYGWIEYSGTVTGKFPDSITIRHVEVVSSILAAAIASQS